MHQVTAYAGDLSVTRAGYGRETTHQYEPPHLLPQEGAPRAAPAAAVQLRVGQHRVHTQVLLQHRKGHDGRGGEDDVEARDEAGGVQRLRGEACVCRYVHKAR